MNTGNAVEFNIRERRLDNLGVLAFTSSRDEEEEEEEEDDDDDAQTMMRRLDAHLLLDLIVGLVIDECAHASISERGVRVICCGESVLFFVFWVVCVVLADNNAPISRVFQIFLLYVVLFQQQRALYYT
jgi:hypothetical protein